MKIPDEHFEAINQHLAKFHAESFPKGITDKARQIHENSYPIDTHMDSFDIAQYFGYDLSKQEWKATKRKCIEFLFRTFVPAGKNKPLFEHVNHTDFRNGGFGGACASAHNNARNFWPNFPFGDPWETTLESHKFLTCQVNNYFSDGILAKCPNDVENARKNNKKSLIFSVEGAHSLGRSKVKTQTKRLNRLTQLKQMGAAYLTLNHFCSTDISSGSLTPWLSRLTDNGLSKYGEKFIQHANDIGFLIDLTHSSTDTIMQVCDISQKNGKSVIASHASFRDCPTQPEGKKTGKQIFRGLEDKAIKAIANTGGCISVVIAPYYLQDIIENKEPSRDASIDLVVHHYNKLIKKLANWGFDAHKYVSFGTDFDGGISSIPLEMRTGGDLPLLTQKLLDSGWNATQIDDMYSNNFLRAWHNA